MPTRMRLLLLPLHTRTPLHPIHRRPHTPLPCTAPLIHLILIRLAPHQLENPRRHNPAWRDNPLLRRVDRRREQPAAAQLASEPRQDVQEHVGDDAGDDTVCNATAGVSR